MNRQLRARLLLEEARALGLDVDDLVAAATGEPKPVTVAATCIRRGIERGEIPDTVDAELIATLFAGAITLHIVERGIDPPPAWFTNLVDATFNAAHGSSRGTTASA